ncbi:hypothetical protein ACE6H2_014054 [Prunus campanulata]
MLRGFRKVANAVVTSLEKHSCPEADTYGTIVRVGESIRRDFVIINLVAKLSNSIPALKWWRLDESVQQFAVFIMSQVAHLCILLFWWKLICTRGMLSHTMSMILKDMIGLNLRFGAAALFWSKVSHQAGNIRSAEETFFSKDLRRSGPNFE